MDVEILARVQFAVTIMFHYIYPPLSIGLGLILVIMEGIYLGTKQPIWRQMARFWTKVFALTFAIGVATGIVMEFEFGTNWSSYSRFVGDVFGSALAAEGVFAFFLESGFLALLLFGWDRVGPKLHFFATVMVALGAHFSAIWIVVANSWMQTPAGYHIVETAAGQRAEIYDFWAMVFNPSSMMRLSHTVIGCWLAGAFLVISVSAFYLLKKKYQDFALNSIKVALGVALVATMLQAFTGDRSAKIVADYQPAKLAAFEGVYQTQTRAPMYLFGIVDAKEQTVHGLAIPGLLSLLTYHDINATVTGLDKFPSQDWPKVTWVFQTYHLMIYMWGLMVIVTVLGVYFIIRGALQNRRWVLHAMVWSVLFPQIANQAGWVSAEMGRYPWIVYNLMRISEGLSKSVVASQVLSSLIMFTVLYIFLFILFIYLLDRKIKDGPTDHHEESPYHQLEKVVKG